MKESAIGARRPVRAILIERGNKARRLDKDVVIPPRTVSTTFDLLADAYELTFKDNQQQSDISNGYERFFPITFKPSCQG
jgi:hypothetical protein